MPAMLQVVVCRDVFSQCVVSHTLAFFHHVLFPVDSMDSCEEMMIQDWPGALYKKDDTAFLCWRYSPEVTYVLEYTPSKIDDSEIIKMAESAEPVK